MASSVIFRKPLYFEYLPGNSYFDSADSFAMIRGGHIDVAIMGGLEG